MAKLETSTVQGIHLAVYVIEVKRVYSALLNFSPPLKSNLRFRNYETIYFTSLRLMNTC